MSLILSGSDFSTREISDALLKLGVPQGRHIPDIHHIQVSHPGGAGVPAYTVHLVLASERDIPTKQQGHFFFRSRAERPCRVCPSAPPGQPSSPVSPVP